LKNFKISFYKAQRLRHRERQIRGNLKISQINYRYEVLVFYNKIGGTIEK